MNFTLYKLDKGAAVNIAELIIKVMLRAMAA